MRRRRKVPGRVTRLKSSQPWRETELRNCIENVRLRDTSDPASVETPTHAIPGVKDSSSGKIRLT